MRALTAPYPWHSCAGGGAVHSIKSRGGDRHPALVLLSEGLAALRVARANRLQTSLTLALRSALASIGLTNPTVAVVSIVLRQPPELGLGEKDQVLPTLTLLVGVITLGTGRTTVLQGIVHLVIFAVFCSSPWCRKGLEYGVSSGGGSRHPGIRQLLGLGGFAMGSFIRRCDILGQHNSHASNPRRPP